MDTRFLGGGEISEELEIKRDKGEEG